MNNFNKLSTSFQNIFDDYYAIIIRLKKTQEPINFEKINDNELTQFYSKLNKFVPLLDSMQNNNILIKGFYNKYYDELIKVKHF